MRSRLVEEGSGEFRNSPGEAELRGGKVDPWRKPDKWRREDEVGYPDPGSCSFLHVGLQGVGPEAAAPTAASQEA